MLVQIVSRERAESEGTEAQQLLWIAEWHEDRIADLTNAPGLKKPSSKFAIKRHKWLAAELRTLAESMMAGSADRAVAA